MRASSQIVANRVGAITAVAYMAMIISVFATRIAGLTDVGGRIGLASTVVILPLAYLLATAIRVNRPRVYFMWIILMILFVLLELLIDHILRLDFRSTQWSVILYVIFFFGSTGGMIGVAAQAGRIWAASAGVVFLVMAAL